MIPVLFGRSQSLTTTVTGFFVLGHHARYRRRRAILPLAQCNQKDLTVVSLDRLVERVETFDEEVVDLLRSVLVVVVDQLRIDVAPSCAQRTMPGRVCPGLSGSAPLRNLSLNLSLNIRLAAVPTGHFRHRKLRRNLLMVDWIYVFQFRLQSLEINSISQGLPGVASALVVELLRCISNQPHFVNDSSLRGFQPYNMPPSSILKPVGASCRNQTNFWLTLLGAAFISSISVPRNSLKTTSRSSGDLHVQDKLSFVD